jgi:hypothetical protein
LLNKPIKRLNSKKKHLNRPLKCQDGLSESVSDTSERLIVKQKTIRVLLDTGSSGDLLFVRKGSQKYIPTMKWAVPQSWGTSNGTFKTNKVGEVTLSFVEYSLSKSVHLTPNIVEYDAGARVEFKIRPSSVLGRSLTYFRKIYDRYVIAT